MYLKDREPCTVEDIKQLKKIHSRMTTVLNELEALEYTETETKELNLEHDADYSEVTIDYRWLLQQLEHRRETLQKRGRTQ